VAAGHLDGARLQDLRPGRRELEHLVVADRRDPASIRHDTRVRRVHPVDVRVDLADVGTHGSRHRDGGQIGCAASERRDLVLRRETLEPGEHDDVAGVERLQDPLGPDLDDLGLPVLRVRDDPRLGAGVAGGTAAAGDQRDPQERHRDPLTGREEHVQLTGVRDVGDPEGHR
jgi:hypothetical protein